MVVRPLRHFNIGEFLRLEAQPVIVIREPKRDIGLKERRKMTLHHFRHLFHRDRLREFLRELRHRGTPEVTHAGEIRLAAQLP